MWIDWPLVRRSFVIAVVESADDVKRYAKLKAQLLVVLEIGASVLVFVLLLRFSLTLCFSRDFGTGALLLFLLCFALRGVCVRLAFALSCHFFLQLLRFARNTVKALFFPLDV